MLDSFWNWMGLDRDVMPQVNQAWNKVRCELCEVGLLANGRYLDNVWLVVSNIPSTGEAGFVYEGLDGWGKLMGYEPGVIYLPRGVPSTAYVPGGTLVDTIRHEYAHAWHWLDKEFFREDWFVEIFGLDYDEVYRTPASLWWQNILSCESDREKFNSSESLNEPLTNKKALMRLDFFSEYATTLACEDFAETFMCYLRYRKSLHRFRNRPGLYRKLRGVEHAIHVAKRKLGL